VIAKSVAAGCVDDALMKQVIFVVDSAEVLDRALASALADPPCATDVAALLGAVSSFGNSVVTVREALMNVSAVRAVVK
jgi:hypothetical protein